MNPFDNNLNPFRPYSLPVFTPPPSYPLAALNALVRADMAQQDRTGQEGREALPGDWPSPWGPAPEEWMEEEPGRPLSGWETAVNAVLLLACGAVGVWIVGGWVWGMGR